MGDVWVPLLLQVHVSTNQLINTARVLADPTQQHLLEALAPLPLQGHLPAPQQQQQPLPNARPGSEPATAPQAAAAASEAAAGSSQQEQQQQHVQPHSAAIVVGEAYYAAKEQLFMAEQAVLRLMRFQLGVQQPHKYLLNFCQLLGLQQQLAAAAVCVLNDAIAYTTLVCEQESAVVAAAALQYVLQRPGGDAVVEWVVGQMSRDVQGCSREEGGRGGGSSRDWRHEPPRHSHRSPHDDSRGSGGSRKGAGTVREADPASGGVLAGGEWIPAVGLQVEQVSAAQAVIHELYTHCNGLQ